LNNYALVFQQIHFTTQMTQKAYKHASLGQKTGGN